jgi:flagellar hook protein FlgE
MTITSTWNPPPPPSDTITSSETGNRQEEDQENTEDNTGSTSEIPNDESTPNKEEENIEMPTNLSETEMITLLYKEIRKMASKITRLEAHIAKSLRGTPEPHERDIFGVIEDLRNGQQTTTQLAAGPKEPPRITGTQGKGSMTADTAMAKETVTAEPANGSKKKSWNEIASSKDKEWELEFLTGTRAIDRTCAHKESEAPLTSSLKPNIRPNNDPRNNHVLLERTPNAAPPTKKDSGDLIFQINKALTENVPGHIHIDSAKPTANGNGSIYSKAKATSKILLHHEIIINGACRVDREVIEIMEIMPWPRVKIHQISLDNFMPFLHVTPEMEMAEIIEASDIALNDLRERIKAEYEVTVAHMRWIRSIVWYMQQWRKGQLLQRCTSVVVQIEEAHIASTWKRSGTIRITGE